jgi:hypothetical protein
MMKLLGVSAMLAAALLSAPASAQKMARSEISKECSKQADEKNLHGKARRHFRNKCKRDMRGSK